ncbi:splicing factor, Prp19-binding domain-containing protein [Emericellopsis atlantica]|uniref:Splicing factor, Prp19-binding domain-containing protein n=1 Tax=Emericellopsis atlantica TaxID=2614577 RepID=A0A9P8CQS3_9HYPO|nr:splicing factor, Prp19-binding domain-containing protein [Emericellopsis atlantica]KAG9255435.1 splicing factor, Prp19-binding domain-containing protein [Emericellopsis atlantica]
MPPKRMTANPVKPSRHRPGKQTLDSSSDSDSDAASEDGASAAAVPPPPKAASAGRIAGGNLSKVDLEARRREAAKAEGLRIAKEKAEKAAVEEGFVTEEESEGSEDDDEDEDEDDDSEEESSSEDEAPRRLMMRPKFVPKSQRNTSTREDDEERARLAEDEAKKKMADELVEEQIKKDLAARAAGKKHWDDEQDPDSDVDTTDGLDPEAEEKAWQVRELKRLRRARLEVEEKEKELEEVERRRNLTAEERQAEDEEHLAKQQAEKESKGKVDFMRKYHHKGAFFQEDMEKAGLAQRDIMGTRIADEVRNRDTLPAAMQIRDMSKLGKKGATKYKDMRSEDTGAWGRFDDRRDRRHHNGGDDRFRPDDDRFKPDERDARGSNSIPLGKKRDMSREAERDGDKRRRTDTD